MRNGEQLGSEMEHSGIVDDGLSIQKIIMRS